MRSRDRPRPRAWAAQLDRDPGFSSEGWTTGLSQGQPRPESPKWRAGYASRSDDPAHTRATENVDTAGEGTTQLLRRCSHDVREWGQPPCPPGVTADTGSKTAAGVRTVPRRVGRLAVQSTLRVCWRSRKSEEKWTFRREQNKRLAVARYAELVRSGRFVRGKPLLISQGEVGLEE